MQAWRLPARRIAPKKNGAPCGSPGMREGKGVSLQWKYIRCVQLSWVLFSEWRLSGYRLHILP